MGYGNSGSLTAACKEEKMMSYYARVFDQQSFDLGNFTLSCIQFGYFMEGQTYATLQIYVDTNGGSPDWASMNLVSEINVTTINAVGTFQVQTATFSTPVTVDFNSGVETLVVVLATPYMSEGFITGGGTSNGDVVNTLGETYVYGDCMTEWAPFFDYANNNGNSINAENQWFVRVHGSGTAYPSSDDGSDNGLSTGAIIGISVAASVVGLAAIGAALYFFVFAKKGDSLLKA
jgi:hypothetical protein